MEAAFSSERLALGKGLYRAELDAIIVGSGPAGATIARELSRRGKHVLILERGGDSRLSEGFRMAGILNTVPVNNELSTMSAFTTGGTTAVYFASAVLPPIERFRALGVDLASEFDEAKRDLPLGVLPDERLSAATLRARDSAMTLGHNWEKAQMLVDQSKCASGYSYDAKWNARTFVDDATRNGAILVTHAKVRRVLVEKKRAIGVEYEHFVGKKRFEVRQAFAGKVILAAGCAVSPVILRDSGITSVVNCGFYCHPSFALFGAVRGLKARDGYIGSMGSVFDGNIAVGCANAPRTLFRLMMLANRNFARAFCHSSTIGVGVMVREGLGGGLQREGGFHKELGRDEILKLRKGEDVARRIIEGAGGKVVFKAPMTSSQIGGTVRIGEHLDASLETEFANLYVCDGSIIPHDVNITPTLTLVCLGKYLAKRLAHQL
jgi:choline dehydrogenase-like flavoprotein